MIARIFSCNPWVTYIYLADKYIKKLLKIVFEFIYENITMSRKKDTSSKQKENMVKLLSGENTTLEIVVGWLVGFYGISTFVGYLISNPFLYK